MKSRIASVLGIAAMAWSAGAHAEPSLLYLRADAGGSFPLGNDVQGFKPSPVLGGGVGLKLFPFLRTDLTVSYRTNYSGSATDTTTLPGTTLTEKSNINSLVGLANAYFDFPSLFGITPYIGGGAGAARNSVGASTTSLGNAQIGTLNGGTKTNFAWQVGVGASMSLFPTIALDVGYHYIDAGKFTTATSGTVSGVPVSGISPATGRLTAQEVEVGIRVGF
jgi:opacity protein-like surface antigen